MKRVTFAMLCLLPISCLNLLANQEEKAIKKPLLHKYMYDGKVMVDNSPSPNHICIHLFNGEKIERACYPNGDYFSCYLTPVDSNSKRKHYKYCRKPTDRLIITFCNRDWSDDTSWIDYGNDLYEYLWALRDGLEDKGVHTIDYDLVFKYREQWNPSSNIQMESGTYSPCIEKGGFVEVINGHLQRGFSIDPKDIKKIEVWNDTQEVE